MGEAIRIAIACESGTEKLVEGFAAALAGKGGAFEEREAAALALSNELARRWI